MSYWDKRVEIEELVGETFTKVHATSDTLQFECGAGTYTFEHFQDCCESVYIESIVGDLQDLVGNPILIARESSSSENPSDYTGDTKYQDSFKWTFYSFATIKGYVDVRWYGESNGYYSESVDLTFTKANDE